MNKLGYCLIGSARHNEYGSYASGKPGDQTGTEVEYQNYYNHKKGWVTLRCIDESKAEMIAQNMEWACANDCVGYSQNDNQSLWREASKINFDISRLVIPANTDCARLVRVCIAYADIPIDDFYTGNLKQTLLNSGWFKEVKGSLPGCLKRGDILVTKTKGHTVIALTDGYGNYPNDEEKYNIVHKTNAGSSGVKNEEKAEKSENEKVDNNAVFKPYLVKINTGLNVRKEADAKSDITYVLKAGEVYTIIEEKLDNRRVKWGRLKSKIGWINLSFTTRV
jgi:hypothetical protein